VHPLQAAVCPSMEMENNGGRRAHWPHWRELAVFLQYSRRFSFDEHIWKKQPIGMGHVIVACASWHLPVSCSDHSPTHRHALRCCQKLRSLHTGPHSMFKPTCTPHLSYGQRQILSARARHVSHRGLLHGRYKNLTSDFMLMLGKKFTKSSSERVFRRFFGMPSVAVDQLYAFCLGVRSPIVPKFWGPDQLLALLYFFAQPSYCWEVPASKFGVCVKTFKKNLLVSLEILCAALPKVQRFASLSRAQRMQCILTYIVS